VTQPRGDVSARPLLGIALMSLATLIFASMDTAIRAAGALLPALLLMGLRYAFQAVVMSVWIAADQRLRFRPDHPRFQAVRGLLLLVTSSASFFGLAYMPVAEFTAVVMLTPVLVTLLAAVTLKERISLARWMLVVGSFGGALLVLRPGSGLFGWAALFPLCGALAFATFQILTRRMAGLDHPLTTHLWTAVTGVAVIAPALVWWVPDVPITLAALGAAQWAMVLFIACCGTFGHLLLLVAYGAASAGTLAPYAYGQIAWAVILGGLVFAQWPDAWGSLGMAMIAACGVAGAWMNLRQRASSGNAAHAPSGPPSGPAPGASSGSRPAS